MLTKHGASAAARMRVSGSKLCSRCNQRLARHRVKDARLCCECYVAAGHEPAVTSRMQGSVCDQKDVAMTNLILSASASRPLGWRDDGFDALEGARSWPARLR